MGLLSSIFGSNKNEESQQARQEKKNFEILKYDGIRARNINQLPYAIKCFEEAITINEETETMEYLASAYLQSGRVEDARIMYDRLVEKEPENVKVLLSLASVCFIQEDYQAMEQACNKAISVDENNKTAYYLAAKAAKGANNLLQAIVMSTKAIASDEEFIDAYLLRAEILWDMRQAKESMEDINTVLSKQDDNEDALIIKGEICAATGDWDEGYKALDKVLSLNPFNEKAYIVKGSSLIVQKEFDKAIAVYDEALELSPENGKFYQERGRAKLLKGDKDGSVEDLKKAIELNPDSENKITGNYKNL